VLLVLLVLRLPLLSSSSSSCPSRSAPSPAVALQLLQALSFGASLAGSGRRRLAFLSGASFAVSG